MTITLLDDAERRIYALSVEQKYDPDRAVFAHRKVEAISDPETRSHQRRILTGVLLPVDPENQDSSDFAGCSKIIADYEKTDGQAEAAWTRYQNSEAGRKARFFSFLDQGDSWITKLIATAIGEEHGFNLGEHVRAGDLTAVRKGEGWKITEQITLEDVIQHIEQAALEPLCDMEYHAGTASGSCMESHKMMINNLKKLDEDPYLVGTDGLRNPYRRGYVAEHFLTVPFFRGNTIVVARVCKSCLNAFSASNQLDLNKLGTVEPSPSGFGAIGGGPIERSEYAWDQDAINSAAYEWKLRNGGPPTFIELQKALQGAKFIGDRSTQEPRSIQG